MSINTDSDICRLSLQELGNEDSISDIRVPVTDVERVFLLIYDTVKRSLIKKLMPNFAISRRKVAKLSTIPAFEFNYHYEYPADCLRILGVGNTRDNYIPDYVVESDSDGNMVIATDENYGEGLPLRFVSDVDKVTAFTPDFKILLARVLAIHAAPSITHDQNKIELLRSFVQPDLLDLSAQNAQENKTVIITGNKVRDGRRGVGNSYGGSKLL